MIVADTNLIAYFFILQKRFDDCHEVLTYELPAAVADPPLVDFWGIVG